MEQIAGIPYREVQFTKHGSLFDPDELEQVRAMIEDEQVTDLFVISHGWKNDLDDARRLYTRLGTSIAQELEGAPRPGLEDAKLAILAVLWPAKKFTDRDLIVGGGAGLGDEADEIRAEIRAFFADEDADDQLAKALELIDLIEDDDAAAADFVELVRRHATGGDADEEADATTDNDFLQLPAAELVEALPGDDEERDNSDVAGGAAGIGDGIADFFGGVRAKARKALNTSTYYLMKKRAGAVGANGLNGSLLKLRAQHPSVRCHLVGHSFGGLLVTAAVNGPAGVSELKVDSLSLLQAAFSHNGFAEDFHNGRDGFFRPVIATGRVVGPVIVTHTKNDKAVKFPYAIASRLRGQDAVNIAGADDRFGAIGSNGAQSTPEVEVSEAQLKGSREPYEFVVRKIQNLLADDHIANHSDVHGRAVANAILEAARRRA